MDAVDIGWFAGLFEGEGCFSFQPRGNGVQLTINSTDRDVLDRVTAVTGVGKVYGPRLKGSSSGITLRKPQWCWQVGKAREVARLMLAMWPLLGERRQDRGRAAVERLSRVKISMARKSDPFQGGY